MREDDVRRVLASPFAMIGSDGVPKPGHPHPRWAGTFPRVLGHYGREMGLLALEVAVHKMTGLAAERFGLAGRGVLRDGAHADLVVLDPRTVAELARIGPGLGEQVLLRRLDQVEDLLRACGQPPAGRGQPQALRTPLDQPDPRLLLQLGQLVGDRGGREPQGARGARTRCCPP